jgi:subtilisin family serine protease
VGGAAGDEDHGTWMADVVHQMAPQAHILSVRVLSGVANSGANINASCSIASGIEYATEHGAKVINLSVGDSYPQYSGYTKCEAKAAEQALADGITVVASVGNDGGANDPKGQVGENGGNTESFPAALTGVIGVAAVTPSGTRASFSTVHSYADVAAPGTDIPAIGQDGTSDEVDGTSPAAAVVSGVAALILSKVPGLAPWQVAEALESTASHPSSWTRRPGTGRSTRRRRWLRPRR